MHSKHLAIITRDQLIRNTDSQCAWGQGELALSIHIDLVLEQILGSVIFRLCCIHLLRKPVKQAFCCSEIDSKLLLRQAHAAITKK